MKLNDQVANSSIKNLSLYHYQSCPFCGVTREAIKYIDLDIEQKDILKNTGFRQELISGGGKPQVPCLKIEEQNGTIHWLYESRDIIKFLQTSAASLTDALV